MPAALSSIPALANGVQFSCDPSITNDGPAGLCNYLNSQIDPLYNNTFTNANADIYIEFANNDGLADSSPQVVGTIDYSGYQTTLEAESTDPAKAFVPAAEPGIFGGDVVEVTSALAQALGLATFGGTLDGQVCYTPGSSGCYNGIIQLNIPADLKTEQDQGYDYPGLSGSTTGTTENYDILSVVEHETDEILGTASCIETTGDNNTELENPLDCASAVDLFRYTSAGELTFDTPGVSAYFSPDGGVTDYDGNSYNDQANGEDWADFTNSCQFVQDEQGCLNEDFSITTDGPGGTPGPEIAILNAVGYDLIAPEPGTMALLGIGLAVLLARRRMKTTAPGSERLG